MTTIAQMDLLITSLQSIRGTLAQDGNSVDAGEFGLLFDDALTDALATSSSMASVSEAETAEDTSTQSFDDFMAVNYWGPT